MQLSPNDCKAVLPISHLTPCNKHIFKAAMHTTAHRHTTDYQHLHLQGFKMIYYSKQFKAHSHPQKKNTKKNPEKQKNTTEKCPCHSPAKIFWNPEMVSLRWTYLPSDPVNTSATWKGWDRNRCILRARDTVSLSSSDNSSIPRIAMMSCRDLKS